MDSTQEIAAAERAEERPVNFERWHFCHLPFGYQILIWAARTWTNESIQPAERWAMIRQAFAKVNAPDATLPFLRLMEVVQAGARVPILVGEGGCSVLADEIKFAELIARAVDGDLNGRSGRCGSTFTRLLSPSAAHLATSLIGDLARDLRTAGMRFPRVSAASRPVERGKDISLH